MNLKETLQYGVGLSSPNLHEINGQTYSDKHLNRISFNPKADRIIMHTLTSLVEYIRSGADSFEQQMIVHVMSPTEVQMYSALDHERAREYIVRVVADVPEFQFGNFIDHENFIIGVQSKFMDDKETDKALLLKFAGTVEAGTVTEYGDDGISQKATIKTGIASKSEALVPSVVALRPYRTFTEVTQPISNFVFRMREMKHIAGVTCGLFEADGGAWRMAAMSNIKQYLQDELNDFPQFIIIS